MKSTADIPPLWSPHPLRLPSEPARFRASLDLRPRVAILTSLLGDRLTGRTAGSGPANWGSNPYPPVRRIRERPDSGRSQFYQSPGQFGSVPSLANSARAAGSSSRWNSAGSVGSRVASTRSSCARAAERSPRRSRIWASASRMTV